MQNQIFGIKDIRLPLRVKQRKGGIQHTVASVCLQTTARQKKEGEIFPVLTNALNSFEGKFSVNKYTELLHTIQNGLQAEQTRLELHFPYFIEKHAPVTQTSSLMEYSCVFTGEIGMDESFTLYVQVPVTTLCPCSKEISQAGAHNQRAEISLKIAYSGFIWIEELIEMTEESASCELYALLKRPDEKFVTEKAYQNPMFVEDVVRRVAEKAKAHPNITWFSAGVESFESIHKHSAFAYVDSSQID